MGSGGGLWVYHESHRGAFHKWECLVLASVEGARLVGIKQVLLELRPVLFCGRVRERCGDWWRLCPLRALTLVFLLRGVCGANGVSLTGFRCFIDQWELTWDDP